MNFRYAMRDMLRLIEPLRRNKVVEIQDADSQFGEIPYWVGKSPRLHLPPDKLMTKGAMRYGPKHPFIRCLEGGLDALAAHYEEYAPRNLAEMYGLSANGKAGGDLPPWEVPWLLRKREGPSGEYGLAPSHGVSLYGPCTPEKCDLEYRRLAYVSASIRSKGYKPDLYGDITGYFLRNDSNYLFLVQGGKHRAAALVFLGKELIPVRMKEGWPRVITRSSSKDWPLVRTGRMSEELALAIFDRYFE